MEFVSGILGSVGGVVYMNVGVYKLDILSVLLKVFILFEDGVIDWLMNKELEFFYWVFVL